MFVFLPLWELLYKTRSIDTMPLMEGKCALKKHKKQGPYKASSNRQKEQNSIFKYCSEISFEKGRTGTWFSKLYFEGEQFIANHFLHWLSFLFCLQTVLQQSLNFTVLFS